MSRFRLISAALLVLLFVGAAGGTLFRTWWRKKEIARLSDLLDADLRDWRARAWPRPPLDGESVPGLARDYYADAEEALPRLSGGEAQRLGNWRVCGMPLPPPREVRELAGRSEAAFALLARGTRTAAIGPLALPAPGPAPSDPVPDLARAVGAARVLDGDTAGTVALGIELDAAGADLDRPGWRLAALDVHRLAFEHGPSDAGAEGDLARFLRESLAPRDGPWRRLEAESLRMQTDLRRRLTEESRKTPGFDLRRLFRLRGGGGDYLDAWRSIRETVPRLLGTAPSERADALRRHLLTIEGGIDPTEEVKATLAARAHPRFVEKELRLRREALLFALELRARYRESGRWPRFPLEALPAGVRPRPAAADWRLERGPDGRVELKLESLGVVVERLRIDPRPAARSGSHR